MMLLRILTRIELKKKKGQCHLQRFKQRNKKKPLEIYILEKLQKCKIYFVSKLICVL